MVSYFLSFAWGICILVSFIGWGGVINRILFPQYRVDWGQRAAWGIAWSVVFGGVLNVTWTISPANILIYICLGALYGIIDAWAHRTSIAVALNWLINNFKQDKVFALGSAIAFLLTILQYGGCVSSYNFNPHDDYHAYLVFPHKMLQIGSLGSAPFSDRRLVSSLGGQSFVQALSFSVLDERSGYLIDPGCALLVTIGIIIGYCQRKKISKPATLLIAIVFLSLNIVRVNTAGLLIPVCLFLSLFNIFEDEDLKATSIRNNAAIVGLLAAAICALKSSFIPGCIIFFTSSYFFYILGSQRKHKAIYEFCFAAIFLAVFVLPWSISMYQSSGTLLYPIFGRGFHGSVYGGSVKLPNSEIPSNLAIKLNLIAIFTTIYIPALLAIRFWIIGVSKKPIVREATLSIFISSVTGSTIIGFSTGGSDIYRYSYPMLVVMFVILLLVMLENIEKKILNSKAKKMGFTGALVLGFLVATASHSYKNYKTNNDSLDNIYLGLKNVPLVTLSEREKYAKMLDSVPQEEIVLTRLDKPFLMNFKNHKVWIADYPGGASLPPGMPSFKGEEALANYLVSKSIRYVAYSYANEANFSRKSLEPKFTPELPFWVRNQAYNTWEFQDSLQKLGETRKRVYDDGENFVIDLSSYQNKR